jgi:hypothetical protein
MTELVRWVIASPEPGADLVASIQSLSASLGSNATTYVESFGEVRDPTVNVLDEAGTRSERQLTGAWDLVSAQGYVSPAGECSLYAVLSRESGGSLQQVAGILARARVANARVRAALTREAARVAPEPVVAPIVEREASPPPPAAVASAPKQPAAPGGPPLPKKPQRMMGLEEYPEEGDIVTHFHFGRCVVVSSDGERIRLQQERDGRVREVALSMLRIEEPTIEPDGKKHWELQRKN